jgi:hypothetical protein
MPKIIIDDAALQLAAQKLKGQAIFSSPDGKLIEPGLINLVDEDLTSESPWLPGDERTKLFTLSAEACRDVVFQSEGVYSTSTRRRAIRSMVVPTCNLMDVTIQLVSKLNDLQSRDMRSSWPQKDQAAYRSSAKRLSKTHKNGPVRWARNKAVAHLDPEIYETRVPLSLQEISSVIGDSLIVLILALNHDSSNFMWIRPLGASPDGHHTIVETMFSYPLITRWVVDINGHVKDVGFPRLAADPRHELQRVFTLAVSTYNRLAALTPASTPTIVMSEQIERTSNTFETTVKIAGHIAEDFWVVARNSQD